MVEQELRALLNSVVLTTHDWKFPTTLLCTQPAAASLTNSRITPTVVAFQQSLYPKGRVVWPPQLRDRSISKKLLSEKSTSKSLLNIYTQLTHDCAYTHTCNILAADYCTEHLLTSICRYLSSLASGWVRHKSSTPNCVNSNIILIINTNQYFPYLANIEEISPIKIIIGTCPFLVKIDMISNTSNTNSF